MDALTQLPKPFFALAPMDDVTDSVFRRIVASTAAPDLFFTEFVNVDGLQSTGRQRLLKKLRFTPSETPLIAQLWGKVPENFYKTAQQLADGTFAHEFGLPEGVNFAGIDLNMGCPVKSEVSNGTCSALINNRPLALEIIQATKAGAGGKLPVSVKTRLGFSSVDMSWPELLLGQELAMLTMHGRTRKEMSKVPAHWDLISKVRELRDEVAPQTLFVGNGDVSNRQHGLALIEQYKLDGIMIGRGVFHDPYVFSLDSPWESFTKEERLKLFAKQVALFNETWEDHERPIHTLNKFCKIYINGFEGSKEMREQFMQATSCSELSAMLSSTLV